MLFWHHFISCAGSLPYPSYVPSNKYITVQPAKPTNDDLVQVLEDVRLGYLLSRFDSLDSTHEWSNALSLGEQQRLSFARLLLSKPSLALLDEATSALDEVNEVNITNVLHFQRVLLNSFSYEENLGLLNLHHIIIAPTNTSWFCLS